MKKISDKITQINTFLAELDSIAPTDFKEYSSNLEKKAACERYIEKIVEATTDLAFLIIKLKRLRMPQDDTDAFNVLLENKIIPQELASKLKCAKGMRNILSHQYGNIDDEIVFDSICQLDKDMKEFIELAKQYDEK
jgi:uncharacterized protein YutE (UPF0331/DUF86 family)